MTKKEKKIREAVANLLKAAGCSCCRDDDGWKDGKETLAMLLAVPMYKDKSGYDFGSFQTEP